MSDTTSTPDSLPSSDAPSSSAVETPSAPSTPAAPADSSYALVRHRQHSPPSSGDSRQSDREGLLAAVRKVVETTPESEADTPSQTDAGDAAPRTQTSRTRQRLRESRENPRLDDHRTVNAPDPTEAELQQSFDRRRASGSSGLLAQRNEARQTLEALQPELTQHRQLQGYLQQHQLAPDDVNMLLGVGASLRRGDYQGFSTA